jgi:hypothetical protein
MSKEITTMNTKNWDGPNNLEECLDVLKKELLVRDLANINEIPEGDMCKYHHNLGKNLRNEWGLWKGSPLATYFNELGIHHADDMSGIILDSFWRRMHGKDIDLQKRVEYCKEYWRNMAQVAAKMKLKEEKK